MNNKSASTADLIIQTPAPMINGCKYQCVITLEDGSTLESEEFTISVEK